MVIPPVASNARGDSAVPRPPFQLAALFVILATAIAGVAWRHYHNEKNAIEHEVRNQLLAIADLKVREISKWRTERMEIARALMADSAGMSLLRRMASAQAGQTDRASVQAWLEELCRRLHFAGATVTDSRGSTLLSVGHIFHSGDHMRQLTEKVLRKNDVVVRDLHFDEPSGQVHLGLNLPLRVSSEAAPFGALLIGIDPGDYLYPLLQRWPVPSQSAEALLARREGNDVVFLNDLRDGRGKALQFRIPLSRTEVPVVRAVAWGEESVEGPDYRGVPVFAAARRVPDTPWVLVAKVDAEEVRAPIRQRSVLLSAAAISLILAAGAGMFVLWRRQQLHFYRARYEAEGERQALVGRYVTEQKAMDERLRRTVDTLSAVIEASPAAIVSLTPDFRTATWNQAAERLFGWTLEEVAGKPLPCVPEDRQENARLLYERVMGGEIIVGARGFGQCKDGTRISLSVSAAPLHDREGRCAGVALNLLDITERVRAKEALGYSEERFRRVVESAPEGIMLERGLHILYLNAAAVRMLGARSAGDLLGHSVLEMIHPEDRRGAEERSALVAGGKSVPPVERRYLRVDGETLRVEVSAAPVEYDGEPASLVYLRDITERARTESEKKRLEEQLRQAQKMESLGRLAGGVAHDFNNHLTVIAGYCDMLAARLAADDPMREEVEEIRAAGDRATALTQQLLAFSRKQIVERKPVNLNEVASEGVKMLRRLIGEDVEIATNLDPALGLVMADRGQMHQVLMNLAVNARDAMPSGGKIVIETANVQHHGDADKDAAPGPYVRLSVTDTGVGMSPEVVQHVFEPFFTTKGMGIGTGLGLSTVYGIVQQGNGWIRVLSEPGRGSAFQIHLPRLEGVAAVAEEPVAESEVPRGVETILVVEDQVEVRRLALAMLRSSGYQLLEACSGPEAVVVSEGYTGPIHLLLTDVVMPGMNGREVATRLIKERPQMKVLYISGYTANAISHEGLLDPGVAYLPKPFTLAQLSVKVRDVLGRASG